MKNLRIGGALVMLMGITLYLLVETDWETFAGALTGAGFGLFVYSFFLKKGKIDK